MLLLGYLHRDGYYLVQEQETHLLFTVMMKQHSTTVLGLLAGLCLLTGFAWLAPPANDNLAAAVVVTADGVTPFAGTTMEATAEASETSASCAAVDDNQSVWWKYTPTTDGTLNVTTSGTTSNFTPLLSLWTGSSFPLAESGCGFNAVNWSVTSSGTPTYYIRMTSEVTGSATQGSTNLTFSGPVGLPVELIYLDVLVAGDEAVVRWSTATETNNAGFDVEHRPAGVEVWQAVGYVEGTGTTTEQQDYSHRMDGLAPGKHYFRLKQVDLDGRFQYTAAVEADIALPNAYLLTEAYPNPFNPRAQFTLTVAQAQQVSIALYDVKGRLVQTLFDGRLEASQPQTFRIDGAGLPSGTYLYRVVGETFTQSRVATLLK